MMLCARKQTDTKSGSTKSTVLIVDDHPIVRNGLALLINQENDLATCGEASTAADAIESALSLQPDIALVDISLDGTNGIELTKALQASVPDTRVLILSMHDEGLYAERALKAGARGYVMKQETPETVLKAIREVCNGGIYLSDKVKSRIVLQMVEGTSDVGTLKSGIERLSDRELEVFQMLGSGFRPREIAASLGLSIKTVETHRDHIKQKMGLQSAMDVLHHAIRWVEKGAL
jgi:DNA-binding NarL/FixJ family response regulator